jgi:hypothetical protein
MVESNVGRAVDQAVPVKGIFWTNPEALRKYSIVLDSKAKSCMGFLTVIGAQ